MAKLVVRPRNDDRPDPEIVRNRRVQKAADHWWLCAPGKERAAAISKTVELIETTQSARRNADLLHMRAYSAGNVAGEGLDAISRWGHAQKHRLRLNLIEQVSDALQAKIGKLCPRPAFLTSQGDWGQRKRAEAMEQVVDGEFIRNRVDDLSPQVALDAFVTGTGFWRVGRRGVGHPVIDRIFPGEVVCDYQEGLYQQPRTLYQTRLVDREYLIESFAADDPSLAQKLRSIAASPKHGFPWLTIRNGHSDLLYVIEAWHLPSNAKAKDGVHTICVADIELLDPKQTKYTSQLFPIVPYRWQTRQFGFFGRGVAEEIMPQQIEINYTLEKIQHILHHVSTVRYWAHSGSKVAPDVQRMSNYPGEILTYQGANPPQAEVLNAVPKEMFEHVATLKQDAFEAVGLSMQFATATKPAGLDSGEAQRVYEDVGTERLIVKGRSYEQCHVELAERVVEVKRAIAEDPNEEESPVVVKVKRARGVTVKTLSFKDVDLEQDSYILTVLPQSSLPGTPTGRKATIAEWLQMGLITAEEGRELLSLPDLKSSNDEHFATRDNVLSAIELISDEGKYVSPGPMLDIGQAKRLVASAYNRLEWEGLPEDRCELIARYASALLALEQAAMPPPQAMPPQIPPPMGQQGPTPGQQVLPPAA